MSTPETRTSVIPPRPTDPKELALWKWVYFIRHYGRRKHG